MHQVRDMHQLKLIGNIGAVEVVILPMAIHLPITPGMGNKEHRFGSRDNTPTRDDPKTF